MRLKLVTPPAVEPVTTADMQVQSRITLDSSETAWATALVTAVRLQVEAQLSRALITQTWMGYLDGFPLPCRLNPFSAIDLPIAPVQSVSQITYYDTDNALQTLSPTAYSVDINDEPGRIYPSVGNSWPETSTDMPNAVMVQFVAGYGDTASTVPACIIQWMLVQLANLYENRESILVEERRLTQIDITDMTNPLLDAVRWKVHL